MIETDTVEGVQKCEATLNLVCLNHSLKDIVDGQRLTLPGEVVGDGENGAKVVRRVAPLSRQETVVVVQPPDLGANVERTTDGVELVVGTGDLRAYNAINMSV